MNPQHARLNRLRSDIICLFNAATSADDGGIFGLHPNIYNGGPAAYARMIDEYDPPKWKGVYCELARNRFGEFSCILYDDDRWASEFVPAMRPVITKFTGPKVAYIGLGDNDLNMPLKDALKLWRRTMELIKAAGFDHVGVDASSDGGMIPIMASLRGGADDLGLTMTYEGAPKNGVFEFVDAFIQTTSQYANPPADSWTLQAAKACGVDAIVTRHSQCYDPDLQSQWNDPAMQPMVHEMFVRQIVAEGGIPALPPFGWAETNTTPAQGADK